MTSLFFQNFYNFCKNFQKKFHPPEKKAIIIQNLERRRRRKNKMSQSVNERARALYREEEVLRENVFIVCRAGEHMALTIYGVGGMPAGRFRRIENIRRRRSYLARHLSRVSEGDYIGEREHTRLSLCVMDNSYTRVYTIYMR